MKKRTILTLAFILVLILGWAFLSQMRANLKDPEFLEYKNRYFQCLSTSEPLKTDVQIYKSWKNGEPSCG